MSDLSQERNLDRNLKVENISSVSKSLSLFIHQVSQKEALQCLYRKVSNLDLNLKVENISMIEIKTKHNLNLTNKSLHVI